MPRKESHTGSRPSKLSFFAGKRNKTKSSTGSKPNKPQHTTKVSKANSTKDWEADYKSLQISLREEKEAHTETLAEVKSLKSDNAFKKSLRFKKLGEEIEDLKVQLQDEVLDKGRLKKELEDERTNRFDRDRTQGFVHVFKNDPALWMADFTTHGNGGGGAGGKRKRKEDHGGVRPESNVVNEDLLKRKKKDNDAWVVRRGEVNMDDDEEAPLTAEMIFKREKKLEMNQDGRSATMDCDESVLLVDMHRC